MKKSLSILLGASLLAVSLSSFAAGTIVCPAPNAIKYVNGNWTAPKGWQFDHLTMSQKGGQAASFLQVEWQAIVKGAHEGTIDWCKYTPNKQAQGDGSIEIVWWGDPAFVKPANLANWKELGTSDAYRCGSNVNGKTRQDCEMAFVSH